MRRARPHAPDRTVRSRASGRLAVLLVCALAAAAATAVLAASPASSPVHAQDETQVPASPAGLEVTTTAGSLDVGVDWDDVEGAADYLVRWRLSGPGQDLNDGVRPSSSNTQITVSGYGEWVVRVQACNGGGCSGPSANTFTVEPAPESTPEATPEATPAPTPEPPATPTGLEVSTAARSLDVGLDWDDVDGADDYLVRWRLSGPGQDLNDGVRPTSSSTKITVADGGDWVARVQACNVAGCSGASATQFKVEVAAPGQPQNLELAAAAGVYRVAASWDATAMATSYRLGWRSLDGGTLPAGSLEVRSAGATVTVAGTGQWQVWVQACNAGGCGDPAVKNIEVDSVAHAQGFQRDGPEGLSDTTTFVSNTDQTAATGRLVVGTHGGAVWSRALAFTTGSDSVTLSEVEVSLKDVASGAQVRVSIWTTASGLPNAKLYDLTNPDTISANSLNTFTAPANKTLDATTTYAVVFENTSGAANQYALTMTTSNAEDSGATTGWSIADSRADRSGSGSWTSPESTLKPLIAIKRSVPDTTAPTLSRATVIGKELTLVYDEPLKTVALTPTFFTVTVAGAARSISGAAVRGPAVVLTLSGSAVTSGQAVVVTYAVPASKTVQIQDEAGNSAAALTNQAVTLGETLVANTGQTTGNNVDVGQDASANHWSQAVAFTTGPNAGTLYEVEVTLEGVPTGAGVKVSVWSATSAGLPDSRLYDLTESATVTANAANTFLAPGDSTLAAGTTYFVVFENTATGSANRYFVAGTAARDEDAGASLGFSIADKRAVRNGTGAWSLIGNPRAQLPKIAVKGTAPDVTPPRLEFFNVDGNTLTATYNESLDDGSTPANTAFSVRVDDSARTVVGTTVVSGRTVTLSYAGAPATSGQKVTMSYTVPSANPIQDEAGNDAQAIAIFLTARHIVAAVSNTGQTAHADALLVGTDVSGQWSQALAFTTGPDVVTLSGVEVLLGSVPAGAGVQVSVWSTTASGLPNAKLYDLANPATVAANTGNTFTAPVNTTLAAGTTYAVVFENTVSGAANAYHLSRTDSNDEDSGAAAGWSIADNRARRIGTQAWGLFTTANSKQRLAIKTPDTAPPTLTSATLEGTKLTLLYSEPLNTPSVPANTAFTVTVGGASRTVSTVAVSGSTVTLTLSAGVDIATQPVTVSYAVPGLNSIRDGSGNRAALLDSEAVTVIVTAVANTGQTSRTTDPTTTTVGTAGAHAWSQAVAFTVGPDAMTLTEVEAKLGTVPATAGVKVTVWSTTAAGLPSAELHVLTNPATVTAASVNTFTAPANATLAAATTYIVVFQNTETGAANAYTLPLTASNGEDAGAVAGWSIADLGAHRQGTNAWTANGNSNKIQVGVKGTVIDTTPPTLSRATVEGTELRLVYNEALDTGSTPANGAFTVNAPGTNPTVTGVSVNGASVVLTLSAAVTARPVTVSYTVPSTNPVQDWAGHDAAHLANRAVELVTELVANTDPGQSSKSVDSDLAQAFTTGSSADGYVLTEVGVDFASAGTTDPPHTVTIQGATASSEPDGTVLATLTPPSSISAGVNIYTASGTGIALAADTTYFVVVDFGVSTTEFGIAQLTADAEDAGAAPGWSIGNAGFNRAWDSTGAWTAIAGGQSVQIEVHGRANDTTPPTFIRATVEGTELTLHFNEAMADDPAPAITNFSVTVADVVRAVNSVAVSGAEVTLALSGADVTVGQVVKVGYVVPLIVVPLQDEAGNDAAGFSQRTATHLVTMVANTGQTANGPGLTVLNSDQALAFTTGAGAVTLSEVQAHLGDVTPTTDVVVSVWSTASGLPSTKLYDLANPAVITEDSLNTFTAPANATLDAATTYAVVFENTVGAGFKLPTTNSDDEDSGAATAWSIANDRAFRSGGSWSTTNTGGIPLIAIRATTGPTLTGALVNGRTLTLTYDKALDTGSTPANNAFTVTVAGQARTVTNVVVSGSTVTLTLSAAVIGGQAVTLSYAVPSANPIQDPTGNDAARLTNQAVTVHGITAIAFTSQPTGNYASIGGHVEVTVTFSEAATVTGTPRIRLAGFSGQTRYAGYVSGTGSKTLVFRYTLLDGDNSGTANVSVPRNGLQLNGGTIQFGSANAPIGHITVDSGKTAKVAAPSVELAFGSPTFDHDLDGTNETYKLGDGISVRVRFTEPVSISGGATTDYQIVVTIGSTDHTLSLAGGSGTANLLFGPHTVVSADADTDGIVIKRDGSGNLVRLSGAATIRSTANGNDAVLTATADLGVRASADAATPLARVQGGNTAPTGRDFSKRTSPNTDLTFALRDFGITDPEGNALKEIQVVTLPVDNDDESAGTLALDGTTITSANLPQTVTRAQLDEGDLVYTPPEDYTGQVTFTFKVVDAFGGVSAAANAATINVANPPPAFFAPPVQRDPVPSTIDFEWTRNRDIESLHAAHSAATGMWGAGQTVWIAQNGSGADDAVYVYDRESGERVAGREFALDGRNRAPRGSWSDGETMWVSDSGRDRLFAYDLASGKRVEARDIALSRRNGAARGIWGDDRALWVLNANPSLFVYDRASGELIAEYALHGSNRDPRGIWSDGVTLWVSDHGAKMLFAYRLPELPAAGAAAPEDSPDLERVQEEEFTELTRASNLSPRGIWSDGEVMYVADALDRRVYTYNMPDAIDARLASLTLAGIEFGEFSPLRTAYEGEAGAGVSETTVAAEATQRGTTVAIAPPDADETAAGHQVALEGLGEITVTVTSADGSRTRIYRVALPVSEQPWAHCLKGAVAEGFSLVVSEGGSVGELSACAESRGVAALYALHEGSYLPYILGAPDFVNRPFAELFADGVPALTALVAASPGPSSDDPVGEVAPPADWPACLHGEVSEGWSLVLYEGGSVEQLAACAGGRNVTALYVLEDGDWVSYILGAPDFVNRPFNELFAEGVPAVTPLIVRSETTALAAGR